MQAHLGAYILEPLHQEVGRPHPELQRAEDVLDGTASLLHLSGRDIQPMLHGIEYAFVLPASDTPFLAGRALRLEFAALAIGRVVAMNQHLMFDG